MTAARSASLLVASLALGFAPAALAAEPAKVSLTLKDHKFSPAEPTAPAGKPIVIELANHDGTPAEFESKALRVEKIVPGGGMITVQVRPLQAWTLPLLRRLPRIDDRGFSGGAMIEADDAPRLGTEQCLAR